jgi:hypothetical protein
MADMFAIGRTYRDRDIKKNRPAYTNRFHTLKDIPTEDRDHQHSALGGFSRLAFLVLILYYLLL